MTLTEQRLIIPVDSVDDVSGVVPPADIDSDFLDMR
jgi:hypothetical protein